jgi:hypothetical protein
VEKEALALRSLGPFLGSNFPEGLWRIINTSGEKAISTHLPEDSDCHTNREQRQQPEKKFYHLRFLLVVWVWPALFLGISLNGVRPPMSRAPSSAVSKRRFDSRFENCSSGFFAIAL